jgi:replicative DNA helicase
MKAVARTGLTLQALLDHVGLRKRGRAFTQYGIQRNRMAQIAEAVPDPLFADLASSDVLWDRVKAIRPLGDQDVFDATVADTHNFLANGIVVENSLEQDADVVCFIYRDEVYNPESDQRGTAEIIVAKHRNGPTGSTRLAFLDHLTKFANMARD